MHFYYVTFRNDCSAEAMLKYETMFVCFVFLNKVYLVKGMSISLGLSPRWKLADSTPCRTLPGIVDFSSDIGNQLHNYYNKICLF